MARQPKPWYWKARRSWYVTINGDRHNLGPDKPQAWDRFHQLMRQPAERKVASQSLAAIADVFLDWVQKNRSADTYEWYRYRLQRFIQKHPDLIVAHLRPYHVQQWVDDYPKLSQTSRRNYLRTVKRCLKWALQQGYIDENPIAHLEVPNAERKELVITLDEFERLLPFVIDDNFAELIWVTWETGCRPQELLRVEANHVDLKNQRWVFRQKESKGKRAPRIVYHTERAWEITQRRLLRFPSGPLFRNSKDQPWTNDAVNCAFDRLQVRMGQAEMKRRGETISVEAISEFIPTLKPKHVRRGQVLQKSRAELKAEAKRKLRSQHATQLVPRYSLYAFRHAWATRALQSGLDALTVAVLMGHADPSTLARVYQHLSHDPEYLRKQAQKAAG